MIDVLQCQTWMNHIKKLEFDVVITNLQAIKDIVPVQNECSEYLLKVLGRLSACAHLCLKKELSYEVQVFKIANRICELLTEVEDKETSFSALYYIIQYLLKKPLFYEALVLTTYLFPGKLLKGKNRLGSVQYYQIANLWSEAIAGNWDQSQSTTSSNNTAEDISSYVKFHLEILEHCDRAHNYVLRAAESYIRKMSKVNLDNALPCLEKIFTHLSEYSKSIRKSTDQEVLSCIISMMSLALFKRKDAINNPKLLHLFHQCDSILSTAFTVSRQYFSCYKFFTEYACHLILTNFMTRAIEDTGFSTILKIFETLIEEYGDSNAFLIKTVIAVTNSFGTLFTNLKSVVMNQLMSNQVTQDNLATVGKFVSLVYSLVKNNEVPKNYICQKCPEPARCPTKKDVYNAGNIVYLFLEIIEKFPSGSLTEKLFKCAKELMEKLLSSFHELSVSGCRNSKPMWDLCGRTIFNIGVISERRYPVELENLYEELCKQVIIQDGLDSKISSFGLKNPVSKALHRLCNSLFIRGKYREAMTYTAYNALISTDESQKQKAYNLWSNIKVQCSQFREIQELTLLQCLRDGNSMMNEKFDIDLSLQKYDLGDLCLRELKCLYSFTENHNCLMRKILKDLESLNNGLTYPKGVLLLCFHTLQSQHCKRELVSNEILKAIEILKSQGTRTSGAECLLANLNFFKIVEKLYVRNQAIRQQINDAKFTIRAFKVFKDKSIEHESEIEDEITPTYGGIDFEKDYALAKELREVLAIWDKCLQNEWLIIADWEPKFTLEAMIIFGEYCRLFKFNTLEKMCWKLSYKLALALQDHRTFVYVTSRSISLRHINDTWIANAEIFAENLGNSTKTIERDTSILFWLSLADFYLDCDKVDDAKTLVKKVKSMPNFEMFENSKLYIYATDIQFRNYHVLNDFMSQEEYCHLLVELNYLIISLNELHTQGICGFWDLRSHLFSCEQLFECMCNVAIPMVSLLSYREASALLLIGLKLAQSLGLSMRIAEILKYLCCIDLLRLRTDDCETKLQDLEHILRLESFQSSMRAQTSSKEASKSPQNDVNGTAQVQLRTDSSAAIKAKQRHHHQDHQRCASPELKRKLFAPPKFLSHKSCCECFECASFPYQQLCQSTAHLRAHMYSLLSLIPEAEHHFHGAARISARLDERDPDYHRRHPRLGLSWIRSQRRLADEMQFKIDLACHLLDHKPGYEEDSALLVEQVIEINQQNRLGKTSALHQAVELYAQRCVYTQFADRSSITVPNDIEITITNGPAKDCVTPKQQPIEKSTRNPRRRKSPVALAIPAITIDHTSDYESNTIGNSPIPRKLSSASDVDFKTKKAPTLASATAEALPNRFNVRRKILIDETENFAENSSAQAQTTVARKSTRLSKKPAS